MLKQKHILVLGASSGIGLALTDVFKQQGAKLTVTAHQNGEKLKALLGPTDQTLTLDFTDKNSLQKAMTHFEQESYDGVVFCAGINLTGPLLSLSDEEIEKQNTVNLLAPMMLTRSILKKMVQHKKGSIIFMGSVAAHRVTRGHSVYSATKAGLEGFTKALASEVAKRGIRINTILPGPVDTTMLQKSIEETGDDPVARIPLGRLVEGKDIAELSAFLLSEKAQMITGTVIPVDGGYLLW